MYAIVVENLTKKFGELVAVNNVSFKVKSGEIFSFLGPNGAGKTTTIHILVTLLKPTSGSAFVAGHDVLKEAKEVRKKIGIVFQEPSLDVNLTAYENLYIHGGIYGYSSSELKNKIDELLRFVELENFRNKVVKTFSGGMARRLEVAKSLIHEPEILFLDEPTIGLDPQTRVRVWEYIERLREEKDITIFLTTHYMDEAEQLSDRIAIIDNGKLIAYDTPENLKSMLGEDIIYIKAENPECFDEDFTKNCKILEDGRIEINVDNASTAIPKIFEIAQKKGIKINDITYHKPTLNDVFIHLTGKDLRDKENSEPKMRRRFA
ncbi:MAG: ATP-binding cassette domain-containing protein [Thermoplasmatales archaeon]|nr:ATP-binding cassette domain-containing protein [Thermoplasmatales archaeon]